MQNLRQSAVVLARSANETCRSVQYTLQSVCHRPRCASEYHVEVVHPGPDEGVNKRLDGLIVQWPSDSSNLTKPEKSFTIRTLETCLSRLRSDEKVTPSTRTWSNALSWQAASGVASGEGLMGVKPPWLEQKFFHHVIWITVVFRSNDDRCLLWKFSAIRVRWLWHPDYKIQFRIPSSLPIPLDAFGVSLSTPSYRLDSTPHWEFLATPL